MNTYWGDLHNHCVVSYGRGRPQRALANAMQHLDFCTITGHAFWPDMPMDLHHHDRHIGKHLGGFRKLHCYWPQLLSLLRQANCDGRFVTLPSYEWHSNEYGDHNVYFNSDNVALVNGGDLAALIRGVREQRVPYLILPHHLGYIRGSRGGNWDCFNSEVSPLVEIYSNHGSCEADDSPYEYHHTMGPRLGEQLVREGLLRGHQFGFYASTDSHDGYPGHYGHGRVGAIASELTRDSIWEALCNRRTIATTGAEISADVRLCGAGVGETTQLKPSMSLCVRINGTSSINSIQIVESDGDLWRIRNMTPPIIHPRFTKGRYLVRIELGWGRVPHAWLARANVHDGNLIEARPYFRFTGLTDGDEACDIVHSQDNSSVEWSCRSSPNPSGQMGGTHFNAGGTQSLMLDIDATDSTCIILESEGKRVNAKLSELAMRSTGCRVGSGESHIMKMHRAVPQREFEFEYEEHYEPAASSGGWLYLRISQTDGQVAWVSPIWWRA